MVFLKERNVLKSIYDFRNPRTSHKRFLALPLVKCVLYVIQNSTFKTI
jgi:hypothetical protein